jgi:hypothetical protein
MKPLEAAALPIWLLVLASSGCPSKKNDFGAEAAAPSDRKPEGSWAPAPVSAADGDGERKDEGQEAMPEAGEPADGDGAREPFGGSWTGCYHNYQPTSTPERDVMRLALLCGPANGMRRLGSMLVGEAGETASLHVFDLRPGECIRIFAVAGSGVTGLSIEVNDADDVGVALDDDAGRWSVLMRDGPLCPLRVGKYTVRVRARRGRDKYAVEIWRFP